MTEKIYEGLFKEMVVKTRGNISEEEKEKLYQQAEKIRIEEQGNEKVMRQRLAALLKQKRTFEVELPTKQDYKERKKFQYFSYAYIALAILILLSCIQFHTNKFVFPSTILAFCIGVLLPKKTKGKLEYGVYEPYCSVFGGLFIIGGIGISFVTANVANFFYRPFWLWVLSILLGFLLTYFISRSEEFTATGFSSRNMKSSGFIVIYFFLFSATVFGSILSINKLYDYSEVKIHTPKILTKKAKPIYGDYGKIERYTYHFKIEKWHQDSELTFMGVTEEVYNQLKEGDYLKIYEKNGLLGIRYWSIYEDSLE